MENREIRILNWIEFTEEEKKSEDFSSYNIPKEFNICYSDILGDLIVEKDNKLYSSDHEESNEPHYEIVKDYTSFKLIIERLKLINDELDESSDLKDIKSTKKELIDLKKISPDFLKDEIAEKIAELKELIDDFKFYQTKDGKLYIEANKFSKDFYSRIGKPEKYKEIYVFRNIEKHNIVISGELTQQNETIKEIEEIVEKIKNNYKAEIELGKIDKNIESN